MKLIKNAISWLEDDEHRLRKEVFKFVVALSVFVLVFVLTYPVLFEPLDRKNYAKNNALSGVIVDKDFETTSSLFSGKSIEYRLYIEYNYVGYSNETETDKKSFTVSETVYSAYNIGDFFDSQDFRKFES